MAEIEERLSKVEKRLGLSKESDSEPESGVVAALAVKVGMMVLEDIIAKKFGEGKTPATAAAGNPHVPVQAATSSAPLTEESFKKLIGPAIQHGMLDAVKDANFRKQFNAELNKK